MFSPMICYFDDDSDVSKDEESFPSSGFDCTLR